MKVAAEYRAEASASGHITFDEFAAKFIADSRQGRDGEQPLEPGTIAGYESYLRNWVNPLIGAIPIQEIDVSKMRNFRDQLISDCLSRNTAKHALTLANSILKYAKTLNVIVSNPAEGVQIKLDWNAEEELKASRIPSEAEMKDLVLISAEK